MNILGSNLCVKNCLTLKIMEPLRGSKSWRNPACELKKIPWVRGSKTRPVGITDSFFDSPSSRPRIGSCLTNPPKMARLILLVESIIRIAMGGGDQILSFKPFLFLIKSLIITIVGMRCGDADVIRSVHNEFDC